MYELPPPPNPGWAPGYQAAPSNPGWPPYAWPPVAAYPTPGSGYPQQAYGGWGGYAPGAWGYGGWAAGPGVGPAPGTLHPPHSPRSIASLSGRAAPRLYALAWLLSLAGLAAVVGLLMSGGSRLTDGIGSLGFLFIFEVGLTALAVGLVLGAMAQTSQRRADGWQDYFSPSPVLLCVALVAMSLAATLGVEVAIEVIGLPIATSVETLLGIAVNLACYVILVQAVTIRTGALTWRDMVHPRRLAPDANDWSPFDTMAYGSPPRSATRALGGDVAIGLALAIPFIIGTLFLSAILAWMLGVTNQDTTSPIPVYLSGWDFWIVLLTVSVMAPLGEEIFFRGFATNAWARSLKRNPALIRAAVLFASVHVINVIGGDSLNDVGLLVRLAILAVVSRIPVGWALAWLYTRRRSIYASFALHSSYNGGLVLLVWWITR
jgi:membrane protease YdiL (CAAX protease family)